VAVAVDRFTAAVNFQLRYAPYILAAKNVNVGQMTSSPGLIPSAIHIRMT